jgi:translation initiation factor 2 alpha subunit (eIF-2alpha)
MSESNFIPDSSLSEPDFVKKYLNEDLSEAYLKARWKWMNDYGTWLEAYNEYIKTPLGLKMLEERKLNSTNIERLFI